MGILDLLILLYCLSALCHIAFSILFSNVCSCRLIGLLGNSCRIRTQIGDDTYCAISLDINTLVKLLGKTHGFLSGKVKCLGRLLLQCTGGKRKGSVFDSLSFFYFCHLIFCVFQLFQDFVHFCLIVNRKLFVCSIEFCLKRLLFPMDLKCAVKAPVFFRNKGIDLFLSVAYDPKRHRLHAPCAQASFYLCPEQRTDAVAYHTVQHSSGLLCIHKIHIKLSWLFD